MFVRACLASLGHTCKRFADISRSSGGRGRPGVSADTRGVTSVHDPAGLADSPASAHEVPPASSGVVRGTGGTFRADSACCRPVRVTAQRRLGRGPGRVATLLGISAYRESGKRPGEQGKPLLTIALGESKGRRSQRAAWSQRGNPLPSERAPSRRETGAHDPPSYRGQATRAPTQHGQLHRSAQRPQTPTPPSPPPS
ncbi:unnamed protein product [Lampetra planeri]